MTIIPTQRVWFFSASRKVGHTSKIDNALQCLFIWSFIYQKASQTIISRCRNDLLNSGHPRLRPAIHSSCEMGRGRMGRGRKQRVSRPLPCGVCRSPRCETWPRRRKQGDQVAGSVVET